MADGLITRRPHAQAAAEVPTRSRTLAAVKRAWRLSPWWARVLAIFALSRVISTALLLGFARVQAVNPWTLAHPNYASFAQMWDGEWYYIVAKVGYPTILPLTQDGHVNQNSWAFLPVYPEVVKALTVLTGAQFSPVAIFVSVVSAAGAALVFYRILRQFLFESTALFAVVLFCVAPLSPLMQVDYAEPLFLFILAVCLLLLLKRRYWWLLLGLSVAAFTRPGVVAFGLALALHWIFRWIKRDTDPFPARERLTVALVAVGAGLLGFAWPVVAALATGRLNAYTATELSWRAEYIGYGKLLPFTSWIQGANWWFPGGAGIFFLIVAVVLFGVFMWSRWVRRLPIDLRFWVVSYVVYLLAVFFPQSSTFRVLMPLFPLLGALAIPRSRLFRILLVTACVAGQWVWIYLCWYVNGYDWTPP